MNRRIILAIVYLLALVSQVQAEDKVTIKDFSISAGESKTVSIELESDVVYAGFQFDLYLPDGITIEEYSADKERIPESTSLTMTKLDDGSYRFLAAAMGLEELKGESGSIITIKVSASSDLSSGNLTGYFRKVKLSKTDGTGSTYAEEAFNITVLAPSIVTAKNYERFYGEANAEFDYVVEGGALNGTPEITCEATEKSPVGTYDIIIKRGMETNFNVTYEKGTLTIKKASLKITAEDKKVKFGEAIPELTVRYDGFVNDETESVLTKQPTITTVATSKSEVGEYGINVSGAEADNYEISYVEGKLTIEKKPIIPGDANGDNDVNSQDITDITNHIMGKPTSTAVFVEAAADMNGDETVNVTDIVILINKQNGSDTTK